MLGENEIQVDVARDWKLKESDKGILRYYILVLRLIEEAWESKDDIKFAPVTTVAKEYPDIWAGFPEVLLSS